MEQVERRQLLSIKTLGAPLIGVLGVGLGRIRLYRYISRMFLAALQSLDFIHNECRRYNAACVR